MGLVASVTGYQMFRVAQAWYVYELTGSPLWLGFAALANAVPGMFFNLFGGVFADRLNKRLLVMCTQAAAAGIIFTLAVLTLMGIATQWHVMIIAFLAIRPILIQSRPVIQPARPCTPISLTAR